MVGERSRAAATVSAIAVLLVLMLGGLAGSGPVVRHGSSASPGTAGRGTPAVAPEPAARVGMPALAAEGHRSASPLGTYEPPSVIANISGGGDCSYAWGAVYDPARNETFVSYYYCSEVQVIADANNTVVGEVPTAYGPAEMAYDPDQGEIFVADYGSDKVTVFYDSNLSVVATVPVGNSPTDVAYDAQDREVWVADSGGNDVTVISTVNDSAIGNVTVGSQPWGVAFDPTLDEVFVSTYEGSGNLSVVDAANLTVVRDVSTPDLEPKGVLYVPKTSRVYEASAYGTFLVDPSNDSVLTTVASSYYSFELADGSDVGEVFGTAVLDGELFAVSESNDQVVWTLGVGGYPLGVAYDYKLGQIYVANSGSDNVTVVSLHIYHVVSFQESGLYAGTYWSVTFAGTTYATIGPAINLTEMNGSFNYTVAQVPGFRCIDPDGNASVAGEGIDIRITFDAIYTLRFTERGLPTGLGWSLSLTSGSNRTRHDVDGTTFSLSTVNATWAYSVNTTWSATYTAPNASGTVEIAGSDVSVAVTFNETYAVSFVEDSLPMGTAWSVRMGGLNASTTAADAELLLPNASDYVPVVTGPSGYAVDAPAGPISVLGAGIQVDLTFVLLSSVSRYFVNETGLPLRTPWSASLSGSDGDPIPVKVSADTISSSLLFQLPSGFTGNFSVGPVPGYTATPASGVVEVNSTAALGTVLIEFTTDGAPTPKPLSLLGFNASPTSGAVGSGFTLTTSVTGGVGALSFVYAGLPTPCRTEDLATLSCTPEEAGNFSVSVTVTDEADGQVHGALTLHVVANRSSGPVSPLGTSGAGSGVLLYGIIGVAAVLVAVGVAVFALGGRRGGPVEPLEAPPEPEATPTGPAEDADRGAP